MQCNTLLIVLLSLLMPVGVMAAGDVTGNPFPYGMLELRGYAMKMSKEGKFRIYSKATTFVEGTFSIDGDTMTISDKGGLYACRGKRRNTGRYYWAVHDQGLYLRLIKDKCGARRTAFLEAPLKIGLTTQ